MERDRSPTHARAPDAHSDVSEISDSTSPTAGPPSKTRRIVRSAGGKIVVGYHRQKSTAENTTLDRAAADRPAGKASNAEIVAAVCLAHAQTVSAIATALSACGASNPVAVGLALTKIAAATGEALAIGMEIEHGD